MSGREQETATIKDVVERPEGGKKKVICIKGSNIKSRKPEIAFAVSC